MQCLLVQQSDTPIPYIVPSLVGHALYMHTTYICQLLQSPQGVYLTINNIRT